MAKYMQESTDIQINEVSGTDNINFSFKSGNSIDTKIGDLAQLETTDKSSIVNAINSVVESGSNTNGEWIKYADGTMICCQKISTGQCSVSSGWGSLYAYSNTDTYNFPQTFTDIPTISIESGNVTGAFGFWVCDYGNRVVTTSSWKGWALIRPTTGNVNTILNVIAIGRWK